MSYEYSYFLVSIISLLIWIILFYWRKDVRKEMLVMSLLFGFLGLFLELVYIVDWWRPLTITKTAIGIEDFIFGFSLGGVSAVIYEEVFKKRIKKRKIKKKEEIKRKNNFILLYTFSIILFIFAFFVLGFKFYISSYIGLLILILYILIKRKDLIIDSLASGFLIMIIAIICTNFIEFITPEWVNSSWYINNLSGIIILKLPLEDVIWFFLSGAFIGPLYEFWKEGKLIKDNRK